MAMKTGLFLTLADLFVLLKCLASLFFDSLVSSNAKTTHRGSSLAQSDSLLQNGWKENGCFSNLPPGRSSKMSAETYSLQSQLPSCTLLLRGRRRWWAHYFSPRLQPFCLVNVFFLGERWMNCFGVFSLQSARNLAEWRIYLSSQSNLLTGENWKNNYEIFTFMAENVIYIDARSVFYFNIILKDNSYFLYCSQVFTN
jgi:hypothetical protein